MRIPRGSATFAASINVYRINAWSSSSVVHACFGPFVGIDDRGAAFGRKANGLLEVFDTDLRPAERRVRRKPGKLDACAGACAPYAQWVVEHRDTVKIAGLAEELAAQVNHGFDVLVAELGSLRDGPLEVLVRVADEFQVNADVDLAHKRWRG